jgi:deoxyribodipyrimidine photo-lyase
MTRKYIRALHIFRRDLRLQDNTALLQALQQAEEVIPAFFFDDRQIKKHRYQSVPALQYMLESLQYLDSCLQKRGSQLFCWSGIVEDLLAEIIAEFQIEAVFLNHDYTPFARKRDAAIEKVVVESGAAFYGCHDALLNEPGTVLKDDGNPYAVFTPFFKKASKREVQPPARNNFKNYFANIDPDLSLEVMQPSVNSIAKPFVRGGRKEALKNLNWIEVLEDYAEARNIPSENGTSGLSAALKFGTVSVREAYFKVVQTFDSTHTLVSELYWRDFFSHVVFHFPHVFKGCFHKKYDAIKWPGEKSHFKRWCEGSTGFPIVDAGMRQLNETGYMHNRVRMIVASFLVKDLLLNWRKGEEYFAHTLIDYDPASNNGNWQWAASTGCDAQPYFRIFNPWRQQERFDPECIYIKRWVPELEPYSTREIKSLAKGEELSGYPLPIVEHREQKEIAEDLFRSL